MVSLHWVVIITFMEYLHCTLEYRWSILYTLVFDISVDDCCIPSYTLLHCIPYTHIYRVHASLLILLRTSRSSYKFTYIIMPGTGTKYRQNDLSVCA